MHRFKRSLGILGIAIVLGTAATACGDDETPFDPGNGNGNDSNVVVLNGDITSNRTLSPDSIVRLAGSNPASVIRTWCDAGTTGLCARIALGPANGVPRRASATASQAIL